MKFSVITIFPNLIENYTDESILGRAQEDDFITVNTYDPREFANDEHDSIDAPPYGGGPGMVMQAEPLLAAVNAAKGDTDTSDEKTAVYVMSARGDQFDTQTAQSIESDIEHAIIICGRYEGIDQRVIEALHPKLISIGPYILTGGELPALIMVDAVSRMIPGVLGDDDSLETDRETAGAPVYTRPQSIEWENEEYGVPEVLLSGHHEKIRQWRTQQDENRKQNTEKEGTDE
jgi:tRNA (guanine37-N1)-methyltransferase